jgi:integrase
MPAATHRLTTARALALDVPTIEPGKTARYAIYWCPETPGFGCRVTIENVRAWVTEQRVDGRSVRRTIGPVRGSLAPAGKGARRDEPRALARGGIEADAARKEAGIRSGELLAGRDRLAENREKALFVKTERRTFGQALREYVRTKRRAKDKKPLKASTVADYLAMLEPPTETRKAGVLHSIADKSLAKLKAADIRELHRTLLQRAEKRASKHGIDIDKHVIGRRADYAMQVLRAVLRHEGVTLDDDPFSLDTPGAKRISITPPRGNPQPIPSEKLGDWWIAALQRESMAADILRFMMLTGLRPGEAAALTVKDFDAQARRVTLADTKNRRPHVVYLAKEASLIVEANVRGQRPGSPIFGDVNLRKTTAALAAAVGIEGMTPHKARHTFATVADSLDISRTVRDRLLNHAPTGVGDANYVNVTPDRLAQAWERVSTYIYAKAEEACKRRGLDPVVTLYGRDLRHLA